MTLEQAQSAATPPAVAGALYRRPTLVTREAHAGRRVAPITDWGFARGLNAVPLTVSEFADAAREYAIAFVVVGQDGQGRPQVTPVALTGLRPAENLCVDAQGRWIGHYIPAFLRRYPFAYAVTPEGQTQLVLDESWEGVGAAEGELILDEQGENTPWLQSMLQFLDHFERDLMRTRALCDRLVAHNLLRGGELRGALPDGQEIQAGGFFMIDEVKLPTLPDEVVLELHRSGLLGLIHMHRVSMGHAQTLARRIVTPAA